MGVSDQIGQAQKWDACSLRAVPWSWFLSIRFSFLTVFASVCNGKHLNIDRAQVLGIIQGHSDEAKLRSLNSWQKWSGYLPSVVPWFLHPGHRYKRSVYQIRVQWRWDELCVQKGKGKLFITVFSLGSHLAYWMLTKGFQAGWGDCHVSKALSCKCVGQSLTPQNLCEKARCGGKPWQAQHWGSGSRRIPGARSPASFTEKPCISERDGWHQRKDIWGRHLASTTQTCTRTWTHACTELLVFNIVGFVFNIFILSHLRATQRVHVNYSNKNSKNEIKTLTNPQDFPNFI